MSDYALAFTIILISLIFIGDLWIRYDLNKVNFILEKLSSFYVFPAFLTYSLLLISDNNQLKWSWIWVASFAISFSIYIFIDFTFLTNYDYESLKAQHTNPSLTYNIFYRGGNVFILAGLLWLQNQLKEYHQKIVNEYSHIEAIRLRWLESFIWIYFTNNLLILLLSLIFNIWDLGGIQVLYLIVYSSIALSLFYLCYNGIRQYSLAEYDDTFLENGKENFKKSGRDHSQNKYRSSSLSDSSMNNIYSNIQSLFEDESLFKDADLKVQDIAKSLGVTTHKVSQTLNTKAGKSFYEFVNYYRVEHLKELLIDPNQKKYTILALSAASGFNSKASLNRVFKQYTGFTPREYQVKNSISTNPE